MSTVITTPTEAANFLAKYAKGYHAGAFATPLAKELEAAPDTVHQTWTAPASLLVAVGKKLDKPSTRKDFTGLPITLPAGLRVATHVAREGRVDPMGLEDWDVINAYAEDHELSRALWNQGLRVFYTRVTAAAEVINVWARVDLGVLGSGAANMEHDRATVVPVPATIPPSLRAKVAKEVAPLDNWDDDFPYYSDGTWSALSLKGFYPRDPGKGVKPSEMPRSWKAEHPKDLERQCRWTVLKDQCPTLVQIVRNVSWWGETERVRLLKMDGGGKLGRHTDITDRAGGTRDGQIVRFHIPLITHPDIHLHTWDVDGIKRDHHLAQYGCYYLDARKPHAVTNGSDVSRIHLVADVVSSPAVREQISNGYRKMVDAGIAAGEPGAVAL